MDKRPPVGRRPLQENRFSPRPGSGVSRPGSGTPLAGDDWEPPPGDWLARIGSPGIQMDDKISGRIMSDLATELGVGGSATPRGLSPAPAAPSIPSGPRPSSRDRQPAPGIIRSSPKITGGGVNRSSLPNLPSGLPKKPETPKDDASMITSLAARLNKVEKLNAQQAANLAQKSKENDRLRLEVESYKANADGSLITRYEQLTQKLQEMTQQRDELKLQVGEMEEFLGDYGLHWVGSGKDRQKEGEFDKARCFQDVDSSKANRAAYKDGVAQSYDIKMDEISSRIDALNKLAEQDAKIVSQGGVARFAAAETLAIVFFADGLQVHDFPFWPYSHESAQKVLADLNEKYFPYCLKDKYPEGVLLKAVDCTTTRYDAQAAAAARLPPGLSAQNVPSAQGQFLGRLPENVIRDGQVISVRKEVEGMVNPCAAGPQDAETFTMLAEGHTGPQVVLNIRMEQGWRLLLTCAEDTTVAAVVKAVNACRWKRQLPSLGAKRVLSSNMPPRSLEESSDETMTQAGLAPNAALFVRVRGEQE
jgi:hypothetical protein